MGSELPFEFFCSELQTKEPQRQLQSIQRMRVICLALGPEKTRNHLLTYLTGEMELGNYMDEVLVAIAYNLGRCVEFIGPLSNLGCLLKPLEYLCTVEETTVRDEAVASLNLVCKSMDPEQVKSDFLPIILRLAKHMDWFTPRVSACGLFPLAMTKVGSDAGPSKDLREAFKQLGIDETPMVRRAAALQLSEFAKALGESLVTEDLLPLYRTLLADEQDSVRVNALKSTPAICKLIGPLRKGVLEDNFKKCVADKSWRVRVACAETIADTAGGCKTDAEAITVVKEIYMMLQRDHEAEVRVATALRSAGVSAVIGAEFGKDPIFPILKDLVLDPNSISRLELAGCMMDMAAPLGKALALELVLPCMSVLLDEIDNTNVRLAIINKVGPFLDVVGTMDDKGAPNPVAILCARLAKDKNWRVRYAILGLMPKIAASMGEAIFTAEFLDQASADEFACDTTALIRTCFVTTMASIAKECGFGAAWLLKNIVPVLEARKGDKSYQNRTVLLDGAAAIAPIIESSDLQTRLMGSVLELCDDKVANLKIDAMKSLKVVQKYVDPDYRTSKIVPKLQEKIQTDDDPDVQFFAKEALALCGA